MHPARAGNMADDSQPQPQPDTKPRTRVWLITSAFSALGYAVTREALKLGDCVVAGCRREEIELERRAGATQDRNDGDEEVKSIQSLKTLGGDSCVIVELDIRYLITCCLERVETLFLPSYFASRNIALCQSALAETISIWGRIDVVLNCDSRSGTLILMLEIVDILTRDSDP